MDDFLPFAERSIDGYEVIIRCTPEQHELLLEGLAAIVVVNANGDTAKAAKAASLHRSIQAPST